MKQQAALAASARAKKYVTKAFSGLVYRVGKLAVETHICVWSLNGSHKYYQAISFNDETQICVSIACTSTPKLL